MPGCLIELGFISTRDEEQYMNSKAAEEAYARGIFNAFLAYRKKHDGNITIPFQVEPEEKEIVIPQIVPQNEVKEEPVKEKKAKEKKEEPVKVETIVVPESPEGLEQIDLSPVQEVSQSAQPAPTPLHLCQRQHHSLNKNNLSSPSQSRWLRNLQDQCSRCRYSPVR